MTETSEISPCFLFHYQYNVPKSHFSDTSLFTIHCTLEKGVEAYYSGFRVVVFAKKIGFDDDFAKAEIHVRPPVYSEEEDFIEIKPSKEEAFNDHFPSDNGLPLYTLFFELIDWSNASLSFAGIRLTGTTKTSTTEPIQIPNTHRVLSNYVKRTTVNSPSCILFLATRYVVLWYRHRSHDFSKVVSARFDSPAHGLRILLPSERRPLFTQPPLEILHHIFSIIARNGDRNENWRKALLKVGLVCRTWWKVALHIIYEDLESESRERLHIERLATTLEGNPGWGRCIKRFSPTCFTHSGITDSALTILKTASNMRQLWIGDVGAMLTGELIEALYKMTELRYFAQYSHSHMNVSYSEEMTFLNATQLTKCFAHWPKLRQASVYKFGQPLSEDGNKFPPAQCALDQITFQNGFVSIAQLRAITASSQDTLHIVVLRYIEGISNKEFTFWLLDFGPNLTSLTLERNVFTRSGAEEHAVDATISKMTRLFYFEFQGPVATVLNLLRFEPTQELEAKIRIHRPVIFDPNALVKALRMTKWEIVDVKGLKMSGENSELIKQANKAVQQRGIGLKIKYKHAAVTKANEAQ